MAKERTEKKRAEKAERREAKAARKQANVVEEKKSKLSNGVLAVMIFGVLIAMFAFVWGYNYFSKDASIEEYIANNGGAEQYGNIAIDEHSTAKITAKGNDMTVAISVKTDAEEENKEFTEHYKSKEGKEELEYIGAYFLQTIKPNVQGFSATAKCVVKVDGKKVTTVKVKYKDAEDILGEHGSTSESTDTAE